MFLTRAPYLSIEDPTRKYGSQILITWPYLLPLLMRFIGNDVLVYFAFECVIKSHNLQNICKRDTKAKWKKLKKSEKLIHENK